MKSFKLILCVFLCLGFLGLNSAFAEEEVKTGEIYVVNGIFNVFSKGMPILNKKLNEAGYKSEHFKDGNRLKIKKLIEKRVRLGKVSYPIILIGHSKGGEEMAWVANELGKLGIKTSLIGLDPGFKRPPALGRNVQYAITYKVNDSRTHYYKKGHGFDGELVNIFTDDVIPGKSLKHTSKNKRSIDKNPVIHKMVLEDVNRISDLLAE